MTLDEFYNKYNGRYLDYDGAFPNQCVDLAKQYAHDMGKPVIRGNGKDWAGPHEGYTWVPYKRGLIPGKGDIVSFSKPSRTGHVSIALSGDSRIFTSFDQNYPLKSRCHPVNHTYVNVLGWLKLNNQEDTVTQPEKNKEKLFGAWQAGTGKYPDQQGVNIQAELDHVEDIRKDHIANGESEQQADCEQWRQYTLEKIQQGVFKF